MGNALISWKIRLNGIVNELIMLEIKCVFIGIKRFYIVYLFVFSYLIYGKGLKDISV